ncbi:MAG TPA: aldehyde ferredoxin oxidoreductase N-terminal domain-containing protein, partial [Thermodesulfobacteriota bacterium]|nr:aldehyde ferredoxin oxidoreductase N-terminal domain-containing protein [Thermodesulfobacteriota bacterium]
MPYGWTGNYLEVDLSRCTATRKSLAPKVLEDFLGGKGIAAKFLWDRVPPEVEPLSPDNVVMFSTGPLTGTVAPAAAKCSIITRSPQTGMIAHSSFGGYWPAEVKYSGLDMIIVSGKASSLIYLLVEDDRVEFREADHLRGKNTYETQQLIRSELKREDLQIVCIGPAGENQVCAASVHHGADAVGARGGAGAVLGSKNVKAIAVRGTKDVVIAKKTDFIEMSRNILKRSVDLRKCFSDIWIMFDQSVPLHSGFGNTEMPPLSGMESIGKDMEDFCRTSIIRERSCYNCPIACRSAVRHPESGQLISLSCEPWVCFGVRGKKLDFWFNAKCVHLCNQYGLDVFSTSALTAFAVDLYKRGILSKADTEGLDLEWGDENVFCTLITKIARREGIGAIFAKGVLEAARTIGKGAEEYAYAVKGLELGHHRVNNKLMALTVSLSETGCLYKSSTVMPYFLMESPKEFLDLHVAHGLISERLAKHLHHDYAGKAELFTSLEHCGNIADLLGICKFFTGVIPFYPLTRDLQARLLSHATGVEMDEEMLNKISERVIHLIRAYNARCGIRRKDDRPPEI